MKNGILDPAVIEVDRGELFGQIGCDRFNWSVHAAPAMSMNRFVKPAVGHQFDDSAEALTYTILAQLVNLYFLAIVLYLLNKYNKLVVLLWL